MPALSLNICNVWEIFVFLHEQISWIRRRDMHIITVDRIVYTNDERFNILHIDGSDDWTLQIKFVQRRDNGTYECQVCMFTLFGTLCVEPYHT